MESLLLELPWPPSVNHYYRHIGPRILISREGRKYRERVSAILRSMRIEPMNGDLQMSVQFFPPDQRRRDLDNLQKGLWDSLQHGGVYRDDSQIKDFEGHMGEPDRPNGKIIVRLQAK
jgi:crossover junction endodeoxyribonuclease RusA